MDPGIQHWLFEKSHPNIENSWFMTIQTQIQIVHIATISEKIRKLQNREDFFLFCNFRVGWGRPLPRCQRLLGRGRDAHPHSLCNTFPLLLPTGGCGHGTPQKPWEAPMPVPPSPGSPSAEGHTATSSVMLNVCIHVYYSVGIVIVAP